MSKERFLLYMLAGIFVFQAVTLGYGVFICSNVTPNESIKSVCPDLGDRYDQTFNLMITSTLALLTGSALKE